ncbi:MAG: RHS repeat-associated core domain-containing protein, partial [Syntrophales bacterium]|nr:RHS repeat-associated core domain-containing protein [Syntrophales bacterium]
MTTDRGDFSFAYDAGNRRTSRTYPNGTATAYAYDPNNRLTGMATTKSGATIASTTYTLDDAGNRITKSGGSTSWSYAYDAIYRLRQATGSGRTETYTYDAVGNRLTSGGLTISPEQTTTYAYDGEDRMTGVTITQGGKTKEIRFGYDPFGRRISKTIQSDAIGTDCANNTCPRTTYYLYDGPNIALEYDQASNITARYTHGPNIDEPLAVEKDNQAYYYHADGLGSVIALSDAQGSIVQQYDYDSFGNMTTTGGITQPFAFTSREFDPETGMYFYRARYYDPKVGRFVTKDPIGFKGGINVFAYVQNNPVNKLDPSGLYDQPYPIGGSIGVEGHFIYGYGRDTHYCC